MAREVRRFQVDFGIMPLISKRFCHRRSRQCVNNAPSKPAYSIFLGHEIGRELNTMSQWLDEHRDLLGLAACDLSRCAVKATGRQGLPAEAVLRCALLKQYRQLSYQELAFHLDSMRKRSPCVAHSFCDRSTFGAVKRRVYFEEVQLTAYVSEGEWHLHA